MNVGMLLFLIAGLMLASHVGAAGKTGFFPQTGASGTEHNRERGDELFYTSNSNIPHLPFGSGFAGTHGTYRFITVAEQTAIMIGEGKHGVWRYQESGLIREYRKKGKVGLRDGIDPNKKNLDQCYQDIIKDNYASFIPDEGFSGYKYPDQRISDGKADGKKDFLDFVDISIYHPKYGGKYNNHVAIDLPLYYCTMSQASFPHVYEVWRYAVEQKRANKMGPLARRAGLDIKENYLNVIRFNLFEDASVWANVGVGDSTTDPKFKDLNDMKSRFMSINYQRVDLSQINIEVYLVERPFFNQPYLFIAFIMENKNGASDFSYLRPHGAYWDELKKRRNVNGMNHKEDYFPTFAIDNYPEQGQSTRKPVYGTPTYGHHHNNRSKFHLTGGACPEKGGDWGRYPWSDSGAGFPSNLQEITPICDGILIDVKFWTNLWAESWNDLNLFLGNAGFKGKYDVEYLADANKYGYFTDPYLRNRVNPHAVDYTPNGEVVELDDPKPERVTFAMNFTRLGAHLNFNNVTTSDNNKTPKKEVTTTTDGGPDPEILKVFTKFLVFRLKNPGKTDLATFGQWVRNGGIEFPVVKKPMKKWPYGRRNKRWNPRGNMNPYKPSYGSNRVPSR